MNPISEPKSAVNSVSLTRNPQFQVKPQQAFLIACNLSDCLKLSGPKVGGLVSRVGARPPGTGTEAAA